MYQWEEMRVHRESTDLISEEKTEKNGKREMAAAAVRGSGEIRSLYYLSESQGGDAVRVNDVRDTLMIAKPR